MARPIVIKKYGNRRLYATDESRYLTLEELAKKIQGGADVVVVEVKTGADLTQATLTQIVVESRGAGKFLPIPLLVQMIRLGDDALAEFLGQYMSFTMELYLRSVRGMQMISPFSASGVSHSIRDTFSRFLPSPFSGGWRDPQPSPQAHVYPDEPPPPVEEVSVSNNELAALREEMRELRAAVQGQQEDKKSNQAPRETKKKRKTKSKG